MGNCNNYEIFNQIGSNLFAFFGACWAFDWTDVFG